jgi:hypothetical protein
MKQGGMFVCCQGHSLQYSGQQYFHSLRSNNPQHAAQHKQDFYMAITPYQWNLPALIKWRSMFYWCSGHSLQDGGHQYCNSLQSNNTLICRSSWTRHLHGHYTTSKVLSSPLQVGWHVCLLSGSQSTTRWPTILQQLSVKRHPNMQLSMNKTSRWPLQYNKIILQPWWSGVACVLVSTVTVLNTVANNTPSACSRTIPRHAAQQEQGSYMVFTTYQ